MIRLSLEADTAAELKTAVQELTGIGAAPSWLGVPVAGSPGISGNWLTTAELLAPESRPSVRCLDIRYATEHPDHLMVELRVGNMRADGCFAVCWHKALPHVRKLVQSTNIFFRCKRLRLVERNSRWPEKPKPKTRTKPTKNSRSKKGSGSAI